MARPLLLTARQDISGYLLRHAGRAALLAVTGTSVLAVGLIFYFIIKEAWPFFAQFGIGEFFAGTHWYPTDKDHPEFGALSLIAGSAYVTIMAMVFAVPGGLLTAVLLSDIVPFSIREIIKPVVEILAAIPSVAYGFFALMVAAPWLQEHFHFNTGTNIINASVVLAVMALPTIVSVSEDCLSAVGRDLREASYSLGATRAETIIKVVMPAAHNGIIAAIILGVMRAVGETMVVWMAAGNASQIPSPWWNLAAPVRTMTATIAGDMGEAGAKSPHYYALFGVALLLLAFTFILNLVTEYLLYRVRKNARGAKGP